jgi:hypothetical protein
MLFRLVDGREPLTLLVFDGLHTVEVEEARHVLNSLQAGMLPCLN